MTTISYVDIVQNHFNHGVIEYLIPREHQNYKVHGRGTHDIMLTWNVDEHDIGCLFIPHHKGDGLILGNFHTMMRIDKDFIRVYTFPSSLKPIDFKMLKLTEVEGLKPEELHFFDRNTFYGVIAIVKKLTNKSLHFKKSKSISCEKRSSTVRRSVNIKDCYDYNK